MTNSGKKYGPQDVTSIITSLGLSKIDAARQMGISYAALNSWETGRRNVTEGLVDLLIARHLLKDAEVHGRQNKQFLKLIFSGDNA